MRYYTITRIKPNLMFVRWFATPLNREDVVRAYFGELRHILQTATQPIYAISDLRDGRITDVKLLYELSKVLDHPHWGGGTSFSSTLTGTLYADVYAQFADARELPATESLESALAALETLQPGIADGVDWERIICAENDACD